MPARSAASSRRLSPLALPASQPFSAVHAEIDAAIGQLGGRVFARMDHASSKTITACTTSAEVEANLRCSERTAARLRGIEAGKAGFEKRAPVYQNPKG